MRVGYFLAAAGLLAQPVTAAEEGPLVLQPSSQWKIENADGSCSLVREFGEGNSKSTLLLQRYEPGDKFLLVLAGTQFSDVKRQKTKIAFGPSGLSIDARMSTSQFGQYGPALVVAGISLFPLPARPKDAFGGPARTPNPFVQEVSPDQEATIEWLNVIRQGSSPIRFAVGSMGRPLEALRTCTEDLLVKWGLDPAVQHGLTRAVEPATSPVNWITPSDFPYSAANAGPLTYIQFGLMVGADGKPTHCRVQYSTGQARFENTFCALMMNRARFTPALDATGKPVASYWSSAVTASRSRH